MAGEPENTQHHGLELRLPGFRLDLANSAKRRPTGIIYQNIDAAEGFLSEAGYRVDGIRIGQIASHTMGLDMVFLGDFLGHRGTLIAVAAAQYDPHALGRQRLGNTTANALAGAGDQRAFIGYSQIHGFPPKALAS
jgi:hypothetical protein